MLSVPVSCEIQKVDNGAWTRLRGLLATPMMVPGATSRSLDPALDLSKLVARLQTSSVFIPVAKLESFSICFEVVLVLIA